MKFLEKLAPEKKKNILKTSGFLTLVLFALLIAPKFWCNDKAGEMLEDIRNLEVGGKPSGSSITPAPTGDTGTSPNETKYFKIAGDYLETQIAFTELNLGPPAGCNVEKAPFDWSYDPRDDRYIRLEEDIPGTEKRPMWVVECEYEETQYSTEVFIDETNDRVGDWFIDR